MRTPGATGPAAASWRRRLEGWVGWRVWAATLVVFVGFLVVVLPAEAERSTDATGTEESPDQSYWYSAADLERMAETYGEEGRAYYVRSRFTFDVVWPLAYGSFLQASVLLASRRTALGRLPTVLVAVPTLTVVADLVENTSAAIVMARWPDPTPLLRWVAPVATFVKWNLLALSFVLIAVGAAAGVVGWWRARGTDGADTPEG